MPNAGEIVHNLARIANDWQPLAVLWHVYFALFLLALGWGVRVTRRTLGVVLAAPLLSVSALAWISSNPFNGAVFAASGATLGALAFTLEGRVRLASGGLLLLGGVFFAFGWLYPHFLDTASFLPYLYAAPAGLIPCPTLSILLGLTLVARGLDSRAWSAIGGVISVFYGAFGALVLGVTVDWVLLCGGIIVLLLSARLPGVAESLT